MQSQSVSSLGREMFFSLIFNVPNVIKIIIKFKKKKNTTKNSQMNTKLNKMVINIINIIFMYYVLFAIEQNMKFIEITNKFYAILT